MIAYLQQKQTTAATDDGTSAVILVATASSHTIDDSRSDPPERPRCELCRERPSIKTNSYCEHVCERCAQGVTVPVRYVGKPVGRNESCPCRSGKKFKVCCKIQSTASVFVGKKVSQHHDHIDAVDGPSNR